MSVPVEVPVLLGESVGVSDPVEESLEVPVGEFEGVSEPVGESLDVPVLVGVL